MNTCLFNLKYLILAPISTLYSLIFVKDIKGYFEKYARSIDVLGNVVLGPLLDKLLRKKGAEFKFGQEEVTISEALAYSIHHKEANFAGRLLGSFLDWIDEDHMKKSYIHYLNTEESKGLKK